MPGHRYVALLRGINVSGRNPIRMSELRELFSDLGFAGVQTYIQSGNVIFTGAETSSELERHIELGIQERFSLSIPVVVRTGGTWLRILEACPFPTAAAEDPSKLHVLMSKQAVPGEAVGMLRTRAGHGESVEMAADCLWIFYPSGSGRSKLTPALIDRAAGSPVTARNWKTALAVAKLVS